MGNLLRIIGHRYDSSKEKQEDIFVDFENCQPSGAEREVYDQVDEVLRRSEEVLQLLYSYRGAYGEIREAINNPRVEEYQRAAMQAVLPLVEQLRMAYEFALELEMVVPALLGALCGVNQSAAVTAKDHLEEHQALFKQFALILDFVLKFDDLKMAKPSVQNDFSYYRRVNSRRRHEEDNGPRDQQQTIPEEVANRMTLFYAQHTPMMKLLSDTTAQFVSENKELPVEVTSECLATMAHICRGLVSNPDLRARFVNRDTLWFALRVMTGVMVLYDHVHPLGVFCKTSKVDVKSCVRCLRDQEERWRLEEGAAATNTASESTEGDVEVLLNALRYSTRNLNSDTTPKQIKALLAA